MLIALRKQNNSQDVKHTTMVSSLPSLIVEDEDESNSLSNEEEFKMIKVEYKPLARNIHKVTNRSEVTKLFQNVEITAEQWQNLEIEELVVLVQRIFLLPKLQTRKCLSYIVRKKRLRIVKGS
jgi:hypothetical protein